MVVSGVTSALADVDITGEQKDSNEQWDDAALATSTARKIAPSNAEVLDMKSLETRKNEDNIAEKIRVEETKAKLAAAREGMEREAAKLKEQQEREKQEKEEKQTTRFGSAAASLGTGGGSWVPPHRRGMASAPITPGFGARPGTQKLDVQNEQLFPDLASAEKILEEKEKGQKPVYMAPKKTPVGGGATWASKTTKAVAPQSSSPPAPAADSPPKATEPKEESKTPSTSQPAATTAAADSTATKILPKKKKKKDLSTFKPSG